jgi:hypothetical protein
MDMALQLERSNLFLMHLYQIAKAEKMDRTNLSRNKGKFRRKGIIHTKQQGNREREI